MGSLFSHRAADEHGECHLYRTTEDDRLEKSLVGAHRWF